MGQPSSVSERAAGGPKEKAGRRETWQPGNGGERREEAKRAGRWPRQRAGKVHEESEAEREAGAPLLLTLSLVDEFLGERLLASVRERAKEVGHFRTTGCVLVAK